MLHRLLRGPSGNGPWKCNITDQQKMGQEHRPTDAFLAVTREGRTPRCPMWYEPPGQTGETCHLQFAAARDSRWATAVYVFTTDPTAEFAA
ncbi:MAG: hypothetical protein WBH86_01700 [Thermogutta sp.]|nr:hypothetical protein [Thermogutta sp.]